MTPHGSPLRRGYGVPFASYTQSSDRDISGAQRIGESDSKVNSTSG